MDKYTIYIICKSEEIFESKKKEISKFNKLISFFYWIPAVFLQIHETNQDLLSKLNTRYNTKEQKRIGHLGCFSAHRNTLLSIINNNSINNIILEEDATIENNLPKPPSVTSPTFPILITYELNSIQIYHYDLYRVKNLKQLEELDFFENLNNNITFIEWPEMLISLPLNKKYYLINLDIISETKRKINISFNQ